MRNVCFSPDTKYYKPVGIPLRLLSENVLELDELEALRLADVLGLYHDSAASQMGVSRQTFGRILEAARLKVADALINGKAIKISNSNTHSNCCSELGTNENIEVKK